MRRTLRFANHHVQASTLAALLALPPRVQRTLAGRPVVKDGQTLDTETQLVLRLQRLLRQPAAESFEVPKGRRVLAQQSALVAGRQPIGATEDLEVGGVPARVYVPRDLLDEQQRPTLVFFHGGGFMYGDGHATHDAACRFLAERAGVQVVSVDYRLAPEFPFPAAYDDALASYSAVVERAGELKVDTSRLAVGGDSAGGNLAAEVALFAAVQELPLAFQLLVYPVTDYSRRTDSRAMFGEGFFLTEDFMALSNTSYVPAGTDPTDPRLSPLHAELPPSLAPAYVVTAGFDPLRDEGEAYARKLADAGFHVELERFPSLIHGFFNWVGVGRTSRNAVAVIADKLRVGLKTT